MSGETVHPEVLWAQRSSKTDAARNIVYLTIAAPDVPKSETKLDIQPNKITFSGKSTTKNVVYSCNLELFEEIDPKESKVNHTDRDLEFVLRKKETKEEFWPRLLEDRAKVHWLKTDFDKWVDEDEQDPNDEEDFMSKAGAFGGGGDGGGFDGIDFSKFGAGPGGPKMDLPEDSDEDEDADDDMPALEGEEEPAEKAGSDKEPATETKSSKIEEIE